LTDKLAWCDRCPYVSIGAFYSTIDGNVGRAKELLRSACNEYDAAVAGGKGDRLHRVAHRLFGIGSIIRQSALAWLSDQSDAPLESYPVVYLALLEYALIPAVERRIEAVHALVKAIGRRTLGGISLPQINALLREPRVHNLLRSDQVFVNFCIQHWRSRKVLDTILAMRCTIDSLKTMQAKGKIDTIYQTGLEQEFADTSAAANANNQWLVMTARQRRPAVRDAVDAKAFVGYLKSMFEPGMYFSMPKSVYEKCLDSATEACPLVDVARGLLSIVDAPSGEFRFDADATVVFCVLNNYPERRTVVELHHIDQNRRSITVAVCSVILRNPAEAKLVVSSTGSPTAMQLGGLCYEFPAALRGILKWQVVKSLAYPELRRPSQSSLRLLSDDFSPLASSIDDEPRRMSSELPLPEDFDGMQRIAAALVLADAFVGSGATLPFHSDAFTFGASIDTVETMRVLGILDTSHNEFGELAMAVDPRYVSWSERSGLQLPVLLLHARTMLEPLCKSKLELIIMLHSAGWMAALGARELKPFGKDGECVYECSLHRPVSYFAALLLHVELFAKGVPSVRHDGVDSYYRSILKFEGARLQEFLSSLGSTVPDEEACRRCSGVLEDGPSEADLAGEVEVLPIGGGNNGGEGLAASSSNLATEVVGWKRVITHTGGDSLQVKIYFDNFSHSSGVQRGLVECVQHGCRRHIAVFGDRRLFCASMYAWVADGFKEPWIGSPDAHRTHQPSEEHVNHVLERVVLEEF
jgi:hypothetical protein